MTSNSVFLYPHVGVKNSGDINGSHVAAEPYAEKGLFAQELSAQMERIQKNVGNLDKPLKFSAHAVQRMESRSLPWDAQTLTKLQDAVSKAKTKGIDDVLILMDQAAWIVNTENQIVVTAMHKENLKGSVFTNIDGAIIA